MVIRQLGELQEVGMSYTSYKGGWEGARGDGKGELQEVGGTAEALAPPPPRAMAAARGREDDWPADDLRDAARCPGRAGGTGMPSAVGSQVALLADRQASPRAGEEGTVLLYDD